MCVCVFVFVYVCIYGIFYFTNSFVDGHLCCFHILAIISSVVMNIGVCLSFEISVFGFSKYIPRSEIAGHMVVLFLAF